MDILPTDIQAIALIYTSPGDTDYTTGRHTVPPENTPPEDTPTYILATDIHS